MSHRLHNVKGLPGCNGNINNIETGVQGYKYNGEQFFLQEPWMYRPQSVLLCYNILVLCEGSHGTEIPVNINNEESQDSEK
jgi:hypothetical protein